jgi:spore coat protein JB
MDDQRVMLEQLRACDFAVYDLILFLDTHPSDENALKDFKLLSETCEKLMRQYEMKYGPLKAQHPAAATDTCWLWINNPWPWDPMRGGMENVGV